MRMSQYLHNRAMRGFGQTGPGESSWAPGYTSESQSQQCAAQALMAIEAYESNVRSGTQAPGLTSISFTCTSPTKAFPDTVMSVPNTSDEINQLQQQANVQLAPVAIVQAQPGQQANPVPVVVVQQQSGGGSNNMFSFNPSGYGVGDTWSMQISGATPNSPVTISASQNGQSMGTSNFGSTDANGNWSLSGQFGAGNVGIWVESIMVGGSVVGSLNFTVTQVTTPAQTIAANPTGGSTNTTNTGAAVVTPSSGCDLSFSWDSSCIGGIIGDVTAIGVLGILAVMFFMSGREGRR